MIKFKKLLLLPLLLSLGFLSSCDEDDEPEVEYMATFPVSGEWVVDYYVETSPGQLELIAPHTQLRAYNTAANVPTEIWLDDQGSFWDYKVRSGLNMPDLSFSGSELQNESYDSKVTVTEGKVFKNGTKVHGVQADSISFKVAFDDDETPYGTIYHASGHRSTGF